MPSLKRPEEPKRIELPPRRALRATINKSLPALQERSRKTIQIALEVLNKGKTLAVAKAA